MTTAAVITGCLNGIVLALTPVQRWGAARESNSDFMAERWFILIGIIAILTLAVLFFVVSFKRTRQERKVSDKLFIEYAEERGLTVRERQILLEIARKAGLKRSESIFTLVTAFDRGIAKMKENLVGQQTAKESKQLETVLSYLREKLGFKKGPSYSRGMPAKSKRLSSRQIPVGRKVHVTRRKTQDSEAIESAVVRNSDTELAIKLSKPITITFGENWNVRYYFDASIWEFDTHVVSYDGNIMGLSHSDNIRYINRRRFLRVPVQKPAFIAHFPFERKLRQSVESEIEEGKMEQELTEIFLRPPDFVPAVVTELGGPGLRIEASIEVKVGDRVLIMFELDRKKERDSIKNPENSEVTTVLKIIEDVGIVEEIGEVMRTEDAPDGLSIAVELTGLNDSDINELIRVTNAASLSISDRNKNVPTSGTTVEHVPEQMGVQGA